MIMTHLWLYFSMNIYDTACVYVCVYILLCIFLSMMNIFVCRCEHFLLNRLLVIYTAAFLQYSEPEWGQNFLPILEVAKKIDIKR